MKLSSKDWHRAAAHLAKAFPIQFLEANGFPSQDETGHGPLLVSVSGGGDSVALWLLLWSHFPDWRPRMEMVTFDHRTRSGESTRDAAWVAEMAKAFGRPVHLGTADRIGDGLNENELRELRRAFQKQTLVARKAQHLFTGHHREDVLESLLIRLCRGSGSDGASGPRPRQLWGEHLVWRPLLSLDGVIIKAELDRLKIPYCEDVTNQQPEAFRNRLRLKVIPALREASDHPPARGAARMRRLLEEDSEALGLWAKSWLKEKGVARLPRKELASLPRAVQRRVIFTWMSSRGHRVEADLLEQILSALAFPEEKKLSLNPGFQLLIGLDEITLKPISPEKPFSSDYAPLPLVPGGIIYFPGGGVLQCQQYLLRPSEEMPAFASADPSTEAWLDAASVSTNGQSPLCAGFREPGQRFAALGAPGSRKLSDCFIDRKIPPSERNSLPVVSNGSGKVWWVPGFPPSRDAAITSSSHTLLHLTYSVISPP